MQNPRSPVSSSVPVGRVVGLWRYPVKSMGAEALTEVDVNWHGLVGDRRWAFIRNGVPNSGFPWFTLRERSDLNHYRPYFIDATAPDKSPVRVRTPDGHDFAVSDPVLGQRLDPAGLRAIKQDRGVFDTFPLSLITTGAIATLGAEMGEALDVQRFRPNILIETNTDSPVPEEAWVGCVLRIGGLQLRIDKRDGRCAVITIDPATTVQNPAILRRVVESREGCLGVYGSVVMPGRIVLGDSVEITAR